MKIWKSKKQREKEAMETKIRAFKEEYRLLIQKYELDFGVYLKVTEQGIIPAVRIVKLTPKPTSTENA